MSSHEGELFGGDAVRVEPADARGVGEDAKCSVYQEREREMKMREKK